MVWKRGQAGPVMKPNRRRPFRFWSQLYRGSAQAAEHKYIHSSGGIVRADLGLYIGRLCYRGSAACGRSSAL